MTHANISLVLTFLKKELRPLWFVKLLKVKNTNFLRENIWGVENSQIFTVTPWKTIHCLRSLQQTMRGPFGMIDYCMVRLYFLFLKFSQESGT